MWPADHAALQALRTEVLEALADPSADVREQAVRAIVHLDTPAEIVMLRTRDDATARFRTMFEKDPDSRIRVLAMEILVSNRSEPDDVRELVLRASTDSHPSIRHAAARLFGNPDAPDALPQLLRMLIDSEASERLSAATAFHRFGAAAGEYLHALEEALARETDEDVNANYGSCSKI